MKGSSSTAQDADFLNTPNHVHAFDHDAADLHRSNLLRVQIDTLLQECCEGTEGLQKRLSHFAQQVQEALDSILIPPANKLKVAYDPQSPFPIFSDQPKIDPFEVSFQTRLLEVDQVAMVRPSGCANLPVTQRILLEISNAETCLGPKDYLRHRYFDRRNRIVWHMFKYLSQKKFQKLFRVRWYNYRADQRTPVLSLSSTTLKKVEVQIHCAPKQYWMPLLRLVPNRCNLGPSGESSSSVFYNNLLVEEMYDPTLNRVIARDSIRAQQSVFPHWESSVILLQIWCQQRGFFSHDGLDKDLLHLMILYLYQSKKANPRMEPAQVFAAWCKVVADTNWLGEEHSSQVEVPENDSNLIRNAPSISFRSISKKRKQILVLSDTSELAELYERQTKESPLGIDDPPTLRDLYERNEPDSVFSSGPVFLNAEMTRNYFARLSPEFCRLWQREARKSLNAIQPMSQKRRTTFSPFAYLFMKPARFWSRHDAYFKISFDDIDWKRVPADLASDVGEREAFCRILIEKLREALGDRIHSVCALSSGNGDVAKSSNRSDQIPFHERAKQQHSYDSPIGENYLAFGVSVNPDTCFRLVDRGPSADDTLNKKLFMDLWGSKAELRRFKDGAIIHAVVWSDAESNEGEKYFVFQNDDKVQAGIVERIIQHIVKRHFVRESCERPRFSLRNMLALVDGLQSSSLTTEQRLFNPLSAHRSLLGAFESLSDFLRKNSVADIPVQGSSEKTSALGLPLAIDAVEALSPSLRYVELFPPIPHPSLGGNSVQSSQKVSGMISSDPVKIQIRFRPSSSWPNDLKALKSSKGAMLVQLADGIEKIKKTRVKGSEGFEGPIRVSPNFIDIGHRGFLFRVTIRSDQEIKLLKNLINPNEDAQKYLVSLETRNLVGSSHHSMVHAVYTSHPSSSTVVRLASRWMACHLMSDHIPFEVIELLVVSVYCGGWGSYDTPGTVTTGFLRFLDLLGNFDWLREPLVVDPQGQLNESDIQEIENSFRQARGPELKGGPPMFVVSPNDILVSSTKNDMQGKARFWIPAFSSSSPETVILSRVVMIARRSLSFLKQCLIEFDSGDTWHGVFQQSAASFQSYSALLRIDPEVLVDPDSSCTHHSKPIVSRKEGQIESIYTRNMMNRFYGLKALRRNIYKNLRESTDADLLPEWTPIETMVQNLRERLGNSALFFYNKFCPEIVAVVWRPLFQPRPFSASTSEFVRPLSLQWDTNEPTMLNVQDLCREISQLSGGIVVDQKLLDKGPTSMGDEKKDPPSKKRKVSDEE